MNVGVSILFLESCQRISPEDEQSAGERAQVTASTIVPASGLRPPNGCDIGKCNVAARGEEEILRRQARACCSSGHAVKSALVGVMTLNSGFRR